MQKAVVITQYRLSATRPSLANPGTGVLKTRVALVDPFGMRGQRTLTNRRLVNGRLVKRTVCQRDCSQGSFRQEDSWSI